MPYPALPDRRMSYHRDGTVIGYRGGDETLTFGQGVATYMSGSEMIELNDYDSVEVSAISRASGGNARNWMALWMFFPEQREITAAVWGYCGSLISVSELNNTGVDVEGSDDTTNGVDGTWETAGQAGGLIGAQGNPSKDGLPEIDVWRDSIKTISFTGAKRAIRIRLRSPFGNGFKTYQLHFYGEKAAGETPQDLIFIDHDTTPGAEYQSPEDFGDRPLGTTVTRQFRVKNASATMTANSINLQCNDSDFVISTDNSTWVATINIASLAAGAESSTMYVRNTTPNPGALLGPRFAEIVALVGSWS